ncbi:MAG: hypothetical protein LUH05_08860 [Candidatus Gastranaerophilales bacterium]|nr:hypothetical protein [Candidatus Gastranaerophilales bacterium]
MTEINNNIPNFGHKIEKIENNKHIEEQKSVKQNEDFDKTVNYVPDTGVLGRSQVKTTKGMDISKSVDEAVALAENNPALLGCSEGVFDSLYKSFLEMGMEPSDAYMNALFGEQELLEIAKVS